MRQAIANGVGALILVLAASATAQARAEETAIADPMKVTRVFAPSRGWLRCAHWLSARSEGAEEARRLEAWALGYASASTVRLEGGQAMALTLNNEDLFSRIDAKCRARAVSVGAALDDIMHDQAAR